MYGRTRRCVQFLGKICIKIEPELLPIEPLKLSMELYSVFWQTHCFALKDALNFSNQSCRSYILPIRWDLLNSLSLKYPTKTSDIQQDSLSETKSRSDFASCFQSAVTHIATLGVIYDIFLCKNSTHSNVFWDFFVGSP